MDRRQQKTRKAIFEAFGSLLASNRYSKITVQDIIDEANVGRTTFYAHFETKDELLREMCTDLFSHVFAHTLTKESTHDFSMETGNPKAVITHILYHLLDHKRNITVLMACDSGELFLSFFRQHLNDLLANHLLGNAGFYHDNIPYDFLVNHISSSFIGMVQWWIKNELRQTPEELADYYMAALHLIMGP